MLFFLPLPPFFKDRNGSLKISASWGLLLAPRSSVTFTVREGAVLLLALQAPQHPSSSLAEVLGVLAASPPGNHSSRHRGSAIVKTLRKTDSRADCRSDCSSVLINTFFSL